MPRNHHFLRAGGQTIYRADVEFGRALTMLDEIADQPESERGANVMIFPANGQIVTGEGIAVYERNIATKNGIFLLRHSEVSIKPVREVKV